MQLGRRTQAFVNPMDELLSGRRPEIDERLMSDILGPLQDHGAASPPSDPQPPAQAGVVPSEEAIAARAYEIYVRTGRLSGTSVQNWLFAKSELEHAARAEVSTRKARPSGQAHSSSPDTQIDQEAIHKRAEPLGSQNNSDVTRRGKSSGG
jgi:hypothetical protein